MELEGKAWCDLLLRNHPAGRVSLLMSPKTSPKSLQGHSLSSTWHFSVICNVVGEIDAQYRLEMLELKLYCDNITL